MRTPRRKGRHFSQQGIALLAATVAVALVAVVVYEFESRSNVDYAAAANARDDMRAHYLARSGINLSRLVIKVQTDVLDKYRRYLGDIQLADYLPLFMGAFGGGKEELEGLAEAVGGIDTGEMKGLGLKQGEFDVTVTTDDGKINLNCANGSAGTREVLALQLTAMLLPTAYDRLFETEDAEGWRRDRATQISALIDYVDRDQARYDAPGTPEDYGYENLRDRYLAKNNYLDSVEEIRLIRGVDDRFWALFGPAFTVYGGCKVNVGAVTDINVIVSIIAAAAKDEDDPVLRDPVKLWALAQRVAMARSYGILFDRTDDFAEFVKDPDGALALPGAEGTGAAPAAPSGMPPVQGMELDTAKLAQVARAGPRRTYRVEATASIGKVRKKIIAVWDKDVQNQNARDVSTPRGTWVYWREE